MTSENELKVDQTLPYNFLAERLVLGSILNNPETIVIVSQRLNIESFYLKAHQIIYKGILVLYGEGKKVDYITLITWLQDNKLTNYIGDLSIIADFVNQVVAIGYLEDYLALIYEKYLRRLLIDLGYDIIESGYSTEIPLEKLFINIEEKLFLLNNKKQKKVFTTSAEIFTQILEELKQKLKTAKLPGLLSSFSDLDAITQGFHNSDLIIIAGRPSMGKTAFSLTLAKNIATKFSLKVIFFSLEMTKQQLLYRLLSTETSISHTKLRTGRVSREEWICINETINKLSDLSLYIEDTPTITVSEIYFKIKRLKQEKEKPLGAIFIDYLQLLEDVEKNENRVQELSKITRSLKKLARELDIPIIVMSQLSRNVETRTNKRPMLSDLRESGSIEQDADVVMMLYRDEYYNKNTTEKNIIEIILAKHRNGPTGTAKLKFNPQYLSFENNRIKN
jgi:replicative DNA helicase